MGRRGFLFLLPALLALPGCIPEPPPPSDPELRAELGIPDEVPIHRFDLSGAGDATRVVPPLHEIREGDVVQFVVVDHRVHLLRFDLAALPPGGREFLEGTRQDAFPPLVDRGSRIVLTFEGAPEGRYPFTVEGSGPPVRGEVVVVAPTP